MTHHKYAALFSFYLYSILVSEDEILSLIFKHLHLQLMQFEMHKTLYSRQMRHIKIGLVGVNWIQPPLMKYHNLF